MSLYKQISKGFTHTENSLPKTIHHHKRYVLATNTILWGCFTLYGYCRQGSPTNAVGQVQRHM